jgi:hypothetical protein
MWGPLLPAGPRGAAASTWRRGRIAGPKNREDVTYDQVFQLTGTSIAAGIRAKTSVSSNCRPEL